MTKADQDLHRYLIQTASFKRRLGFQVPVGFHYFGPEDYVLDHGGPFDSAPLTPEELAVVNGAIDACRSQFRIKQCFYNAQRLALADSTRTLLYTEGLAMGLSTFPCLHGWVTINNKVVDLTWRMHTSKRQGRLRDRVFGELPEGWAYNGVKFDTEWVAARWKQYGMSYSYLDDMEHGFPIFQEPRLRKWEELVGSKK